MIDPIAELEKKLLQATEPLSQIEALNQFAWALRDSDSTHSLSLAEQAYELGRPLTPATSASQQQLGYALTALAYHNHYYKAEFELALSQALMAVTMFEETKHLAGLPPALNIAGLSYVRLGDPSEAMEFHLRALDICKQLRDHANEAEVYNHIGIVYVNWGEHRHALDYFGRSLALHKEVGNKFGQAVTQLNRCMTFRDLGDYQNSLIAGFQSFQLLENLQADWPMIMALCNVGNTYLALNQKQEAFQYFHRSLELIAQVNDKFIQAYVLLNVGRAYYQLTAHESARIYLFCALEIAQESKQKSFQFECHQALAETFKRMGDFEQALFHFEQYHQLNREVFNEQSDRRLKNLEVRHRTETAQKEAQIYHLKNVELEREILERRRLQAELQNSNAQLTELNAGKDRFFSIVAHDLRGPFAPLMSMSEFLAHSAEQLSPPQIKEASQAIHRSAQKIYALLENLLEWSRLQLGHLEYQPAFFGLFDIVDRSVQLFTAHAHDKGITLQIDIPDDLIIYADRYMLDTIVRNLTSNALKFTPSGGTVTIKAKCPLGKTSSTSNGWTEVWVSDTGVGLNPKDLDKLFRGEELYHTAGTAQEKGTGLGLIICKEMIERNGGQLSVDSKLNQGATFRFTVPVSPLQIQTMKHSTTDDSAPSE
ncbi:MAG TPA: tetratricopeptide repeat-containing sensor histidine kinase [Anaerolineae bacterium]|nr:tetratricopeptide repeat-containing sensor histidine kinase [Anaerolineae bacterium]HMR63223.1 tetratricopeptide repeat-containing sensor histidine kinase [Anaerolineae bacterium]